MMHFILRFPKYFFVNLNNMYVMQDLVCGGFFLEQAIRLVPRRHLPKRTAAVTSGPSVVVAVGASEEEHERCT
jgi:hypothetical protein